MNRSESEQQQKQDFLRGKRTRNRTNNQETNKTGKEEHPSESNCNKKKFKVLINGDSQLRRVDESKLSNSHRDVEKRFQPGIGIGSVETHVSNVTHMRFMPFTARPCMSAITL